MNCSYCQKVFNKKQGKIACEKCPVNKCKLIKCPYCGFENILKSRLVTLVQKIIK